MKKIVKIIFILISLVAINSCSNNTKIKPKINDNNVTTTYIEPLKKLIDNEKLDEADDLYIQYKAQDSDTEMLTKSAEVLAKAHMDKKEYIIANFFIQEALSYKPYDEKLKFLLVKNQYLAALNNKTDQSYLEKALKAIEENQNLITEYDYLQKSQKLVNKVKELLAKSYLNTALTYKRLNKEDAYNIYIEKINNLGVNIDKISNKEVK